MTVFSSSQTLGTVALPASGPFANPLVRDLVLIAIAVVSLSLLAQVSFTVPFSANRTGELVPITGQTFGVLLIAVALGARRGTTAVAAYLGIGLIGAPVFADATRGAGILFTGATAGYLWGMLLAAAVVGFLADRGLDRGPWLYGILLLGTLLIYAVGVPVLELWLNRHGLEQVNVLNAGLWPFIPGDLAKLMGAALLVPAAWSLVGRERRS